MRIVAAIAGIALCLFGAQAQEVLKVTWPTKHASTPADFPRPASDLLPAFRLAISVMSESNVVALALSQPSFLGLSQQEATRLQLLCAERYRLIQGDPVFRSVASALPYCYSGRTPDRGLAFVYCPKKSDEATPCLVFLHGYGGCFLWAQQLLAEAFPSHIIICPAYGISSASLPSAYLSECLAATKNALRHAFARPTLIGISAGGFGAARVYTQAPEEFSRLIVLAAFPPSETLKHFDNRMAVYFLAGGQEPYVQSHVFERYIQSIRPRVSRCESRILPGADHFFLLARKKETVDILRSWLGVIAPSNERK